MERPAQWLAEIEWGMSSIHYLQIRHHPDLRQFYAILHRDAEGPLPGLGMATSAAERYSIGMPRLRRETGISHAVMANHCSSVTLATGKAHLFARWHSAGDAHRGDAEESPRWRIKIKNRAVVHPTAGIRFVGLWSPCTTKHSN